MLDFIFNYDIMIRMLIKKLIVRFRMWYADVRGHHGKRWNYEPSDHYMGNNKRKTNDRKKK